MSELSELPASQSMSRSQRLVSPVLRVSLLLGVAVHLVGFLVFKVRSNPLPSRVDPSAYVEYVSHGHMNEDAELQEKAMLFDSAPLFIPTQWNVAAQTYERELSISNWIFDYIEPQIDLEQELKPSVGLILAVDEVHEPMDLLASPHWSFFKGFVGKPGRVEPMPEPQPFAELRVAGDGGVQTIPLGALTYEGQPAPEPVVYWIRIAAGVAIAPEPLLGKSSGSRPFDQAVLAWLKRPATQLRLPDGYVSITVYPE